MDVGVAQERIEHVLGFIHQPSLGVQEQAAYVGLQVLSRAQESKMAGETADDAVSEEDIPRRVRRCECTNMFCPERWERQG